MTTTKDVGARIRQAREAAGLTQAELGKKARVSVEHIIYVEEGIKPASASLLERTARATHCTIEWLQNGSGDDIVIKKSDMKYSNFNLPLFLSLVVSAPSMDVAISNGDFVCKSLGISKDELYDCICGKHLEYRSEWSRGIPKILAKADLRSAIYDTSLLLGVLMNNYKRQQGEQSA